MRCLGYVRALEAMLVSIGEEVRTLVQQGNRDKAQVLLAKKKLVEKEVLFLSFYTKILYFLASLVNIHCDILQVTCI